jgi:hypothetical protein
MIAGRELDALVAEKVMGWREIHRSLFTGYKPGHKGKIQKVSCSPRLGCHRIPNYSTDIAAAWEVVEKVTSAVGPHREEFNFSMGGPRRNKWTCQFCPGCVCHPAEASADTVPLAICLAALKAIEGARVAG